MLKKIFAVIFAAAIILSVTGCMSRPDVSEEELSNMVSLAITDNNMYEYSPSETIAEGHIILHSEKEGSRINVYALTSYGTYSFENNILVRTAGSKALPVKIAFDNATGKEYLCEEYTEPETNALYEDSIRENFPQEIVENALNPTDEQKEALKTQELDMVKGYLEKNGRTCEVSYDDLDTDEAEISAIAAAAILEAYPEYPNFIGTSETLQNGIRYVYERKWEPVENEFQKGTITFLKYKYGTDEILEKTVLYIDGVDITYKEGELRAIDYTKKYNQ